MKTPRPYQLEAESAVYRDFETKDSTVLVLPTGMGKTVVMARIASAWDRGNVLLLAHRIELLDQAADKLEAELGYRPPIEQAARGLDPACLFQGGIVVVGSVQTLTGEKRREKYRQHPFGLILVDECHHATSESYLRIINGFRELNASLKVLGVTATPRRADNIALGTVFNSVSYQIPILEAIEGGWLVPIRQEFITVEGVDFNDLRSSKNDFGEADFRQQDLEAVLIEEEPLHAMAVPIVEKSQDKQALVFCAGVEHAHLLAGILNRTREGSAVAIDGTTPAGQRAQAVEDFKAGKLQFLTNFGCFTEGFDAPNTSLVIMGRPTKSLGLYTQMLGRGLRPLDGIVDGVPDADDRRMRILMSNKPHCLVLDFVGVSEEHKLVSAVDALGGEFDPAIRARAKKVCQNVTDNVGRAMVLAQKAFLLEEEQKKRRAIKAQVSYQAHTVDPFGDPTGAGQAKPSQARGGASDAQVGFLVNLGVAYETASGYSRKQASAVIDDLASKRCTVKQAKTLSKYGYDPAKFNVDSASKKLDEIASAGWRRPPEDNPQ